MNNKSLLSSSHLSTDLSSTPYHQFFEWCAPLNLLNNTFK
jgi:hypothetical protein